jgi:hypothetical protein
MVLCPYPLKGDFAVTPKGVKDFMFLILLIKELNVEVFDTTEA